MFEYEQYVQSPRGAVLHRQGPYAAERDRYLTHLAAEGRAVSTMRLIMGQLRFAAKHLDLADGHLLNQRQVARQLRKPWLPRPLAHPHTLGNRERGWRLFMTHVTDWLRFIGRFREPSVTPPAFERYIREYTTFHRQEKGFTNATLVGQCQTIHAFFQHLTASHRSLSAVTEADTASFLAAGKARGWRVVSQRDAAQNLRSFLRFAAQRNWCPSHLSEAIHLPRVYRHATLPLGPRWNQVRQLIASTRGSSPKSIRDRAMILLLAVYGFRVGEVAALRLEDIDWQTNVIRLRRSKCHRPGIYPLTEPVGQAILRYLQRVRPTTCPHRTLFISRLQPFRPVNSNAITAIVRQRQQQLGQKLTRYGAHGLRHACATHLLAEGFTFKQIGDQLGHTSSAATGIYAKVDLAGLREVAAIDIKELVRHDRACADREAGLWPRRSVEALREVADVTLRRLLPYAAPFGTRR